jgi:hypothetical protein
MDSLFCTAPGQTGCLSMLFCVQLVSCAFLAILFLQSGIDKIVDRAGNLDWLTGHFANSPLKGVVPMLLTQITLLEVAAGALSAAGVVSLLFSDNLLLPRLGALLSAVSLLALFFGQRLAKEYAGAAVLVPYLLLAVVALYSLS